MNVLDQCFRVHRARPQQPQSASVAHGSRQPPSAAPYHTSLYDGVLYAEEFCYSVFRHDIYSCRVMFLFALFYNLLATHHVDAFWQTAELCAHILSAQRIDAVVGRTCVLINHVVDASFKQGCDRHLVYP